VRDRHHASDIPAGMALMSRCCALWDEPKTKQNRLRDLTLLGKPNQIETCRTDATNGGSQRNALPDEISKQRIKNDEANSRCACSVVRVVVSDCVTIFFGGVKWMNCIVAGAGTT
jgi:hypothetical protein